MPTESLKDDLIAVGRKLVLQGLVTGSFGNLSARLPESNYILVTPSGMDYSLITPGDLVTLDLDGNKIRGERKATSEAPMHLAVYASRGDVNSIIHTHSPYATTLACAEISIPPVHYLMAGIGGEVPVIPYETFGTQELGKRAAEALGKTYKAVLLGKHGVIAIGTTVRDAYFVAETVEYAAGILCRMKAMNINITTLTEEQLNATNDRFYTRNR